MTRKTQAQSFTKKFAKTKDGRGCYLALKEQGEGPAAQAWRKAAARALIGRAQWNGKGNYTFHKFCTDHFDANAELEELGEPVPATVQVQTFLDSIQCKELEMDKKLCEKDSACKADFKAAQQFMLEAVHQVSTSRDFISLPAPCF